MPLAFPNEFLKPPSGDIERRQASIEEKAVNYENGRIEKLNCRLFYFLAYFVIQSLDYKDLKRL